MFWIERWLGLAPDGGSGSFELMLILVPLVTLATLWRLRRSKHNAAASAKSPSTLLG